MHDVFLSYARVDAGAAEAIGRGMEREGWTVFWDRELPPGSQWREALDRELRSARCAAVLWSDSSVESRFVREEAEEANRRGILLSVLISRVQPPLGFREEHAVDLSRWNGERSDHRWRSLMAAITQLATTEGQKNRSPATTRRKVFLPTRDEARRLGQAWVEALLERQVDRLLRMSELPFFTDGRVLVTERQFGQQFATAGTDGNAEIHIKSLRLYTVNELIQHGVLGKDSPVATAIHVYGDDWVVQIVVAPDYSGLPANVIRAIPQVARQIVFSLLIRPGDTGLKVHASF